MSESSMEKAIAREFERELGVPSDMAKSIASDVSDKVKLKLENPPCPNCDVAFPKLIQPGEKVQCPSCHNLFAVEDSAEKAVSDVLKANYEKVSQQLVQRVQILFSSNVEEIIGNLIKIETPTNTRMQPVLEIQKKVQAIMNKLRVPVQIGPLLLTEPDGGAASDRAEVNEAVYQFDKTLKGLDEEELLDLDLDTLIRVGNIHLYNQDFEKALLYYHRTLTICPNNVIVWKNVGNAYCHNGLIDYKKAIEAYENVVKITPDSEDGWLGMADAYYELGEYRKAIEMYERASKINPTNEQVWSRMGYTYDKLGEYRKAIEMYDRAAKIEPDNEDFWESMGYYYDKLGEYRKAIEMYERAAKINPENKEYWEIIGEAHRKLDEYRRTIEMHEKVININPDDEDACVSMGIAYRKLGEYRKAIEMYERAIKIRPDYPIAWANMGIAYQQMGDKANARKCYLHAQIEAEKAGDAVKAQEYRQSAAETADES